MDIYSCLISDHRAVAKLMDDLLAINLQTVQQRLFEEIRIELDLHSRAEEDVFYRALAEADTGVDILHARHDHSEIRALLATLSEEAVSSPHWMVSFGELKHAVDHHVAEEEGEIFTAARHLLSPERADLLGEEMEIAKAALRAELPSAAEV